MFVKQDGPGLTVRVVRFPVPAPVVRLQPTRDRRRCGWRLADGRLCRAHRQRGQVTCWQHRRG